MKIKDWLLKSENILKTVKIASARLDCLILLEDSTDKDRAWILANSDYLIPAPEIRKLDKQVARRALHEPLAYIRGKSEFYGREFKVTPSTLQPRPETETMIDLFQKISSDINNVIDVGTGSGCIAITLKLENKNLNVLATEINSKTLDIARFNAGVYAADVDFYQGNLLDPISNDLIGQSTAILGNLPYVPNSHTINKAAMQEPKVAIFGGKDGLKLYREMFSQISKLPNKPKYILTESLPMQHNDLAILANQDGYKQIDKQDLIQVFSLRG